MTSDKRLRLAKVSKAKDLLKWLKKILGHWYKSRRVQILSFPQLLYIYFLITSCWLMIYCYLCNCLFKLLPIENQQNMSNVNVKYRVSHSKE